MVHTHERARGTVFQYGRKYLSEGQYWLKGICKNIKIGDQWVSVLDPKTILNVVSIDKVSDSKGKWNNPEDGKQSLFEGVFYDFNYEAHGSGYEILRQY